MNFVKICNLMISEPFIKIFRKTQLFDLVYKVINLSLSYHLRFAETYVGTSSIVLLAHIFLMQQYDKALLHPNTRNKTNKDQQVDLMLRLDVQVVIVN